MKSPAKRALITSALLVMLNSAGAAADDGISADKILFGQVAALSGPAQALGQGMREGLVAAFEEANRAGGIDGRKLVLKSVDDGYEPEKTIEATKKNHRRGQGFCFGRLSWNADLKGWSADCERSQGAFHRPFYRRRVPARSL